ncbi:anti-sigma factor family protein [Solilutibacter silvestris]|uniref:anti-sigma factor family protein n=1 Tax=Solilutibacter silvestris TaxID=1645665 RepID=UPI003D3312C6
MALETGHELLPLYLDGELDAETSRAFEAHLDACTECQARLAELEALRSAIRTQAHYHAAPDTLRQRIMDASAPRKRFANWPPLALAASWAAAFLLGGALMWTMQPGSRQSSTAPLARDLITGHLRALAAASPVDVVSSDHHTVKPWFAGKLAISPLVQDFANEGYALVGGRIDYVGDSRVPVLVYRHGQHLADVFVLPQGTTLAASQSQQGYAIDTFTLGGQPAALVSDLGDSERAQLKQLLANAR